MDIVPLRAADSSSHLRSSKITSAELCRMNLNYKLKLLISVQNLMVDRNYTIIYNFNYQ